MYSQVENISILFGLGIVKRGKTEKEISKKH
jgi:hypothetical protein